MKKSVILPILAALMFLATGCAALGISSSVASRVRIGMSVGEFKRLAGQSVQIDAMSKDYTVYRIDKHNIGYPDYIVSATLFHFDSKDRLIRVETRDFAAPPVLPPYSGLEP